MTYNVISTGSGGNAVAINNQILIDCGVPLKRLSDVLSSIGLVLLTHRHSDHFNPATVRALHRERPTVRFGCCRWMVEPLLSTGVKSKNIDVYEPGFCFIYQGLCTVKPEALTHNVPNCGYHIWWGGDSLFYATDTGTLDGIEAKNYSLYLIESNHTKDELARRLKEKREAGEYAYELEAAQNHLSREQAEDWISKNIGPSGQYAFLHQHKEREAC